MHWLSLDIDVFYSSELAEKRLAAIGDIVTNNIFTAQLVLEKKHSFYRAT